MLRIALATMLCLGGVVFPSGGKKSGEKTRQCAGSRGMAEARRLAEEKARKDAQSRCGKKKVRWLEKLAVKCSRRGLVAFGCCAEGRFRCCGRSCVSHMMNGSGEGRTEQKARAAAAAILSSFKKAGCKGGEASMESCNYACASPDDDCRGSACVHRCLASCSVTCCRTSCD